MIKFTHRKRNYSSLVPKFSEHARPTGDDDLLDKSKCFPKRMKSSMFALSRTLLQLWTLTQCQRTAALQAQEAVIIFH